MGLFGDRSGRRIRAVLNHSRATWALEQWAKTEILHAVDAGIEPDQVFAEIAPLSILVQDARNGAVDANALRSGLATLVQRCDGWVSIGVWRLIHQHGPAEWLVDDEIRMWFVDGLRAVASTAGGRQFPYQPDRDEEAFLRQRAGDRDPLWLFIPVRNQDLVARTVPGPGEEPPWTELPVGDERRLAVMTSDSDSNIMVAQHRKDGSFVVVIDAPRSDEDPGRTRFDLLSADTLPNLYRRVGHQLSTRSSVHWVCAELEPYFPYERPPGRP